MLHKLECCTDQKKKYIQRGKKKWRMSLRISLRVLGRRESSRNFSDSVIKQWDDSSVITQYIYKGKCYSSSSSSSSSSSFLGVEDKQKFIERKGKI